MFGPAFAWLIRNRISAAELAAVLIMAAGAIVIIVILMIWQRRRGERAAECLQRQANKRNGTFTDNTLSFPYDGVDISLSWSVGSRTIPAYTYVTFLAGFPADKTFRIASKGMRSVFDVAFGSSDLEIVDDCVVQSNDEAFIRELLTPELQANLSIYSERLEIVFGQIQFKDRFTSALGNSGFKHAPGRFFFSFYRIVREDSDCDHMIETAILFHDNLKRMALSSVAPQG